MQNISTSYQVNGNTFKAKKKLQNIEMQNVSIKEKFREASTLQAKTNQSTSYQVHGDIEYLQEIYSLFPIKLMATAICKEYKKFLSS